MVRFTKYHGWYTRVYPAYVLTSSGEWKEENTYYWDRNLTTGNLAMVLDDVVNDVKALIERDKAKGERAGKDDEGTREREFQLFEDDKLKGKKSGFALVRTSAIFFPLTLLLLTAL